MLAIPDLFSYHRPANTMNSLVVNKAKHEHGHILNSRPEYLIARQERTKTKVAIGATKDGNSKP